jgi:hypothetical protein
LKKSIALSFLSISSNKFLFFDSSVSKVLFNDILKIYKFKIIKLEEDILVLKVNHEKEIINLRDLYKNQNSYNDTKDLTEKN